MDGGCRTTRRRPAGFTRGVRLLVAAAGILAAHGAAASAPRDRRPPQTPDNRLAQSDAAPDRQSIWSGIYTDQQAARGRAGYAQACASCHASDLLGVGTAPALVGQPFSTRWSNQTVEDILQTVRRTMPQDSPDSLRTEQYLDILSYILQVQGAPAGVTELTANDPSALRQTIVTERPGNR
jgi:quinoprotein glucose dehydrogenase